MLVMVGELVVWGGGTVILPYPSLFFSTNMSKNAITRNDSISNLVQPSPSYTSFLGCSWSLGWLEGELLMTPYPPLTFLFILPHPPSHSSLPWIRESCGEWCRIGDEVVGVGNVSSIPSLLHPTNTTSHPTTIPSSQSLGTS